MTTRPGAFDDGSGPEERFWGSYLTGKPAGPFRLDLYYLGLRRRGARFADGEGRELRHSVGLRLSGERRGWDWDWEALYQWGALGAGSIAAWTIATETGFTFTAVPGRPRLSLKADIASGDGRRGDDRLGTFNALYPKFPYFSEANLVAPANLIDLHPSVEVQLARGLQAELGWDVFWRHRSADAVYTTPLVAVPGTAGAPGRFTGHQAIAGLEWRASERLTIASQYVHFFPGDALARAGGRDVDFLFGSVAFKF